MKLCECGCGKPTRVVKGKPNRYLNGHSGRVLKSLVRKPGRPRTLTDAQVTEAVRLYEEGWSVRAIAGWFTVTHPTIMLALKQSGVELRKRGGGRPVWRDPIWGSLAWLMYAENTPEEQSLHGRRPPKVRIDLGGPAVPAEAQRRKRKSAAPAGT